MVKYIVLLVSTLFVLGSCGGDSGDCTAETVAGTYAVTTACSDPTAEGPTLITVSGTGNDLTFTDDFGDSFDVELNGCSFDLPEISVEFFGIAITTSGSGQFDGTRISIDQDIEAAGQRETCTITGQLQ